MVEVNPERNADKLEELVELWMDQTLLEVVEVNPDRNADKLLELVRDRTLLAVVEVSLGRNERCAIREADSRTGR